MCLNCLTLFFFREKQLLSAALSASVTISYGRRERRSGHLYPDNMTREPFMLILPEWAWETISYHRFRLCTHHCRSSFPCHSTVFILWLSLSQIRTSLRHHFAREFSLFKRCGKRPSRMLWKTQSYLDIPCCFPRHKSKGINLLYSPLNQSHHFRKESLMLAWSSLHFRLIK